MLDKNEGSERRDVGYFGGSGNYPSYVVAKLQDTSSIPQHSIFGSYSGLNDSFFFFCGAVQDFEPFSMTFEVHFAINAGKIIGPRYGLPSP